MGDDQAKKLHESLRIELDYKNEYTNADISIDKNIPSNNENGNAIFHNQPKTTSQAKPVAKKKAKDTVHLECDLRVFDKYQNLEDKDVKGSLDLPAITTSDSPRGQENRSDDDLHMKNADGTPNLFSTQNMDGFKSILKDANNNDLANVGESINDTEFSFAKHNAKTQKDLKSKSKKATFNNDNISQTKKTESNEHNDTFGANLNIDLQNAKQTNNNTLTNMSISKKEGVDILKDYFNMS